MGPGGAWAINRVGTMNDIAARNPQIEKIVLLFIFSVTSKCALPEAPLFLIV